jgi:hypothetical protein
VLNQSLLPSVGAASAPLWTQQEKEKMMSEVNDWPCLRFTENGA